MDLWPHANGIFAAAVHKSQTALPSSGVPARAINPKVASGRSGQWSGLEGLIPSTLPLMVACQWKFAACAAMQVLAIIYWRQ